MSVLEHVTAADAIVILTGVGVLLLIVAWIELGIRRRRRCQTDVET